MKFISFVLIFSLLQGCSIFSGGIEQNNSEMVRKPTGEATKNIEPSARVKELLERAKSNEVKYLKAENIPLAILARDLAALRLLIVKVNPTQVMLNRYLFLAVENGFKEEVEFLLKKGGDPNTKFQNKPILNQAARLSHSANGVSILESLLQYGANVNAKGPGKNTPLHRAAKYGSVEAIQLLISSGADVKAKNLFGFTPYHISGFRKGGGETSIDILLMPQNYNAYPGQ